MAGTLALNVEILGEFKKLTQATKGAQGTLGNLNKTASKISSGMNKAFGAIGVGFSLAILVDQFKQASVAAIEEVKSMKLLETAMINTGKATAGNVSEAEEFIKSMMIQTSIADDALRPAYQKLFIATGDVTKSNRLLKIALDASAGTGKDLDAVTQAMAKSLAGNDVALNKLIPSLRGVKDPMGELERTFKGAAEAAADTDPYKRMQIIFGEMQEQVGIALLPVLNQFSDWLATPEGQAKLQEIVDGIVAIIEQLVAAIAFIDENKDWLVPMVIGITAVTTAWNVATAALTAYKTAAGISAVAGAGGAAALAGAGLLGAVGVGAAVGGFQQGQVVGQTGNLYTGGQRYQGAGTLFGGAFQAPTTNNQNVTINVNNGNVNAQQIANAINRRNRSTGTNVIRNIR
jgi:hypothetical protein